MDRELVLVVDFGGQYNQLVARRVRECNVYCEIYSYRNAIEKIKEKNPKGIILTGGPNSVYEEGAPTCSRELFELGIPVLGLCYGAQLMAHVMGGEVKRADHREYGKTDIKLNSSSVLFKIKNRLAKSYILKEGETVLEYTDNYIVVSNKTEDKELLYDAC